MRLVSASLCFVAFGFAPGLAVGDQQEAKLTSLEVTPTKIQFRGAWSTQSLAVHGSYSDGSIRDVTRQVAYASAASNVATVDVAGIVRPAADGETKLTVSVTVDSTPITAEVSVTVVEFGNSPVDFVNHVAPTLNRLGCNAAKCHGAQKGQGEFKLSMFGAWPSRDYEALVNQAEGKRVNRDEPAKSLFLQKATETVEHGGGKKLEPSSWDFKRLEAWVRQGTPLADEKQPTLTAIEFNAAATTLAKGNSSRPLILARYSDDTQRDVTLDALLHVPDEQILQLRDDGALEAVGYGEAAVVATYLHKSCVLRVAIPQSLPFAFPEVKPHNKIDELVLAKLKQLGIPSAELCSDHEFLRRVYLDVTGTLPTTAEARAFLADEDAAKRAKLIDRLLASEEFADYWALKWGDLLRVKSEYPSTLWPNAVQAYHQWVRASIAGNKPYDQFVRELLTASGSNFRNPPANYYRAFLKKDPQNFAEVTSLLFMGARVGCARCHGHPTESWNEDDVLGMAAFFAQVRFKATTEWKEEIVYVKPNQKLGHPTTKKPVTPKFLDGSTLEGDGQDPRVKFAAWLTSPENPWFARNAANRVWFWLLGRGIVHEPDDLRDTNPPANPELLAYLTKELVSQKYDLKHLYRLILNSRTYQASARSTQWNAHDDAQFSHYYVKRLGAETLLDAISQITDRWDTYRSSIPEPFVQLPTGFRATHLADGSIGLPFLEMFGRPPRDTAYESDRDSVLTMRQTLHLLNSEDVQRKIAGSPRLQALASQEKDHGKMVDEIYLSMLSRFPSPDERQKVAAYLAAQQSSPRQAVEDLVWAVLNTKEFVFNH